MARKKSTITVFAPATVANLACGFDVMGLAINEPGDELLIQFNSVHELRIKKISGDGGKLSADASKNTATVSIRAMLNYMELNQGFDVSLKKKMPLGSGLGSSAASAAAGVVAANELLGKPFSRKELVPFAMEGERIACGAAHADNVAPALLGGIVLIRSYHPLDLIELPVPPQLFLVVIHPHAEVLTKDSRAVLPDSIALRTGIQQWANTASLVSGLYSNDYSLIARSVEDLVAEPARAELIPHFKDVKEAALQAGALACSISGSGPSVFAMVKGLKGCETVGKAMKQVYNRNQLKSDIYISRVNKKGVQILK